MADCLRGCAIASLFLMAVAFTVGAIVGSSPPRISLAFFAVSLFGSVVCLLFEARR